MVNWPIWTENEQAKSISKYNSIESPDCTLEGSESKNLYFNFVFKIF